MSAAGRVYEPPRRALRGPPSGRRSPARLAAVGGLIGAATVVAVMFAVALRSAAAARQRRADTLPMLVGGRHRGDAPTHDGAAGSRTSKATAAAVTEVQRRFLGQSPAVTLPFAIDPGDRIPSPGEVPSLYADGVSCSTGCRPYTAQTGWPLRPFHRQHPIRAGLNELRPGSLHVGVDIQAEDGAAVYAVQPGRARVLAAAGPNARVQVGNYVYWHIVPTVVNGQYVWPFQTIVGTVMAGYGHIAFSEVNYLGQYVNPLRPGGTVLQPELDLARPVIASPAVSGSGQVVVDAYSPQSFVRRTTYLTPVLAPAAVAYRVFDRDGNALTPLEWAFRGTHLLPWSLRRLIYAPGAHAPGYACFATRAVCVPRWVYRVAGGLAPALPIGLAPGRYRLTIYAWNWADRATARDTWVTATRSGWRPLRRFPWPLLSAAAAAGALPRAERPPAPRSGVPISSRPTPPPAA